MKNIKLSITVMVTVAALFLFSCSEEGANNSEKKDTVKKEQVNEVKKDTIKADTTKAETVKKVDEKKSAYVCPGCGKKSDKAGTCPDCDMEYIENVD